MTLNFSSKQNLYRTNQKNNSGEIGFASKINVRNRITDTLTPEEVKSLGRLERDVFENPSRHVVDVQKTLGRRIAEIFVKFPSPPKTLIATVHVNSGEQGGVVQQIKALHDAGIAAAERLKNPATAITPSAKKSLSLTEGLQSLKRGFQKTKPVLQGISRTVVREAATLAPAIAIGAATGKPWSWAVVGIMSKVLVDMFGYDLHRGKLITYLSELNVVKLTYHTIPDAAKKVANSKAVKELKEWF